MYITKLRNVGGSVMFAIPKSILESLGVFANEEVGLSIENGRLVVEPRLKPLYRLNTLLDQCDMQAEQSAEDNAWLNGPSCGNEAI